MTQISAATRCELVRDQARSPAGAWITCGSDSMVPTVRPGQRVRVVAGSRMRAGDVVLFRTSDGEGLVLHRVVFAPRWSPWFVHIGDAGARAGLSHRDRVIGVADLPRRRPRVTAYARGGARVLRALRRR